MGRSPDFTAAGWAIVNDGVMGGCSRSAVNPMAEGLQFTGHLSLDNGGGFASIRRSVAAPPLGVSALSFEARGDGRSYQCRLRKGDQNDGIAWRLDFPTSGEWRVVMVPFDALRPVFRGRDVPEAGPLKPEAVGQLGFLLADGRAGDFELFVRRMRWATDERGEQVPTTPR